MQIVLLLADDAQFVALDLRVDLELGVLDALDDVLGQRLVDTLLQRDFLPRAGQIDLRVGDLKRTDVDVRWMCDADPTRLDRFARRYPAVSPIAPTRMSALTTAVKDPESSIPSRFTVLKPLTVNVTEYVPGRRSTIRY